MRNNGTISNFLDSCYCYIVCLVADYQNIWLHIVAICGYVTPIDIGRYVEL